MNIHEYQAKELLKTYGVAVLDGYVAWTPEEAEAAAGKLPGPVYVVKSQIHAGGRGAGHFADDPTGLFRTTAVNTNGQLLDSFTYSSSENMTNEPFILVCDDSRPIAPIIRLREIGVIRTTE